MYKPEAATLQDSKTALGLRARGSESRTFGTSGLVAMAIVFFSFGATYAHAAEPKSRKYQIEAQNLSAALKAFAAQSGMQLIFSESDVGQVQTTGIKGELPPWEALNEILKGTDLQFEFTESDVIVVKKAGSRAVARMTSVPQMTGKNAGTREEALRFAQNQPQNEPNSSRAAGDESKSNDPGKSPEEIVVVGSRLKRALQDTPASVTVFDQKRMVQLGASNVGDILNYLPQQSFAINEQNGFGGARVARLRGLGHGTTLVLINGRRTVTSALQGANNSFDLNTIPMPAIERIEILSDSASAVYGADAVGGVINIILKNDVERPTLDLYHGAANAGADERRISATLGLAGDRFKSSLVLDAFDRGFLLGQDRDLYADQDYRRFGSVDRRSVISNPGTISSLNNANLPGLPSRIAGVPAGSSGVGLTPSSFLATAGIANVQSLGQFQSVVPESKRQSGYASAEIQANDAFSIFGELMFVHAQNTRLLSPAFLNNTSNVSASNPFNPFGTAVTVRYLFSGIGPTRELAKEDNTRGVLGMKGTLGSWDWEVTALETDSKGSDRTFNRIDTARVNIALASTDPAQALNVFQDGPGANSAVLASLVAAPIVDRFESNAFQGSAFVRGQLFDLPSGSVHAVFGAEGRKEEIRLNVVSANSFTDARRHTSAEYVEARVPLVSSSMNLPLVKELALTIAGRHDDYSDFGSTTNPQADVEWRVATPLLFRISYGESFRAPPLAQLQQPIISSTTNVQDPLRNSEFVPISASSGGNADLEPEIADIWTFGLTVTPQELARMRLAMTYWDIDQDSRIQLLGAGSLLRDEGAFPGRVLRAAPTPSDIAAGLPGRLIGINSTYVNFGRVQASGIDAQLSALFPTSLGSFEPSISATWVERYRAQLLPGTVAIDRVGVASPTGTIGGSIPKYKIVTTLSWTHSGFALAGTLRYTPAYDDATTLDARNNRTVDSAMLCDLQGSIDLGEVLGGRSNLAKRLTLRAGVINVFDKEPSFSEVFTMGFDPSQADLRQRFGYASLSKTF